MLELHRPRPLQALSVASLRQEFEQLREVQGLMQQEASLFAAGDIDALPALSARRDKAAKALQAIAGQRAKSLKMAGIGDDAQSLDLAIDTSPEGPQLRAAWEALRREYRRSSELNRDASAYVQRQLHYLQTRWNGLMQIAGDTALYCSRGTGPNQKRAATVSISA